MKLSLYNHTLFSFTLLLLVGCIEPYPLPESSVENSFLVVDGFLNSETGIIQVRITRTKPVNDSGPVEGEPNASVILENNNDTFSVVIPKSDEMGNYRVSGLSIDPAYSYRIKIRINEKEYVSTFSQTLFTPEVDSISWVPYEEGVKFRVSTHGTTTTSAYYLWEYDETWEYRSSKVSGFKMVNDTPRRREIDDFIYTCWQTNPSTQIIVKSTDQLSTNVVTDFELARIPIQSGKLNIQYSMLLKQVSINKEAYDFWSELQKTTENVGGLFDPQPGQVLGNISCISDPDELVIGIFSIGSVRELRTFLKADELPEELKSLIMGPGYYCPVDTVFTADVKYFPDEGLVLLGEASINDIFVGYTYTTPICADCRARGGTTSKPSFWR